MQYYYQCGSLYRLRALGERRTMDITVGRCSIDYYYYYAAFNAPCVGHMADELQRCTDGEQQKLMLNVNSWSRLM